MALYFIGDLQGCHEPLQRLLLALDFSPSRDQIYVLGDLVNRGPSSLAVLKDLMRLQGSAHSLLGNHDLHLLAVAAGVRKLHADDSLQAILDAPDREHMIDWLRAQRLAMQVHGWLLVHAGVLPSWTAAETVALAGEVEATLRSDGWTEFLTGMYGNLPDRWDPALEGADRLRVIVNALTRLRFCTVDGRMEFHAKGDIGSEPAGYVPWFAVPGRKTADVPLAFGHWSTLGVSKGHSTPMLMHNTLGLDTGCVWGGHLTAARLVPTAQAPAGFELISVPCGGRGHLPDAAS
ncbi:MAG: symmetrical bis(5'-nucleosyl)-tetraphosphatase [Pseudomonadota bacterium]